MSYVEDVRALKRCKAESQADWLVWRKGKFSEDEMHSIKRGLESWIEEITSERNCSRDDALEMLKWARENKLTAWCDIATRCSLPDRKIGAIRHCILRRLMPGTEQRRRWTKEESAEFVRLQQAYGPRAWKQIAQETGRTLEEVVNKGRQIEQQAKFQDPSTKKFPRDRILRVKLTKLIRGAEDANPYEFSAIRGDCKIVMYARKYTCPDGQFETIHGMPSAKIGKKVKTTTVQARTRWHCFILPNVVRRATISLSDSETMDEYLLLRLYDACRGKLVDTEGNQVFPCYDWEGVNWPCLMPLWPQSISETRLRPLLQRQPKFGVAPLLDIVQAAVAPLLERKKEIKKAARAHFDEIRRILNIIADRGKAFIDEETEAIELE